MENLKRYGMKSGSRSPNRGLLKYFMVINHLHTTLREASFSFQTFVLYACNFANDYNNALRMSSRYTIFCGQTNRILRVSVYSTSTTVTASFGIILMLCANVSIKFASASVYGLVSSGTLSWAPICYLTG